MAYRRIKSNGGFIINPKKTYRLMKAHGLLLQKIPHNKTKRQWVKGRIIKDAKPMEQSSTFTFMGPNETLICLLYSM
ncbi:MAG: hypothetical protein PWR20_1454 [Bacteroidales bacterium]|jgi:hypothetical protein|nr:hypothetical protein [Bacteroidales bacterium]MDN5329696.1 hypothetical protein [Bacteroidales bacterium]